TSQKRWAATQKRSQASSSGAAPRSTIDRLDPLKLRNPLTLKHLGHVQRTLGIDGGGVRGVEVARLGVALAADAGDQEIVLVEDRDAALEFGDVAQSVAVDDDVARLLDASDLAQVLAFEREALDAPVLAVADVHLRLAVALDHPGRVGQAERSGRDAGLAPRAHVLAAGSELVDARVAVAVGHIDVTVGRHAGVRRAIEVAQR